MKVKDISLLIEQNLLTPSLIRALQKDQRASVQKMLKNRHDNLCQNQQERLRLMQMYTMESEALSFGLSAGIDEAGRGPLAGPVYAAAVMLPIGCMIKGLKDSKKLKHEQRKLIRIEIEQKAIDIGWGYASVSEIEQLNILQATFLAMRRAYEQLRILPDYLLIDGNMNPGFTDILMEPVVDGDNKSASIAAASIIAKERRDEIMGYIHQLYPSYGFDQHKGYGTREHYKAIEKNGTTIVHRKSFLEKGNPYG